MNKDTFTVAVIRINLIISFCLGIHLVSGQNVDSLTQILAADTTSVETKMKLYNQLSVFFRNSNYEGAVENAREGLKLAKQQNNRKWEGVAYSNLGGANLANRKFAEAEKDFNRALAIFQTIGYTEGVSDSYGNLGAVFNETGEFKKSIELTLKANHLRDSLGLKTKLATGYTNLSNSYIDAGDFDQAKMAMQQAINIRIEQNDQVGLAQSYSSLIGFFGRQRMLDSALFYAQKTLPIYESVGNLQGMGKVNYNCGHISLMKGDYEQAYVHYAKARDIFDELGNEDFLYQCEMSLGMVLHRQLEFKAALEKLRPVISYFEQKDNKPNIITSYTNYGNIFYDYYKNEGREDEQEVLDTLLNIYNKVLFTSQDIGDKLSIARSLANVGTVQWKQQKYEEAIITLEQAISDYRALGSERSSANAMVSLGKCYLQMNDPEKAIAYLEKAKDLQKANGIFIESLYEDLANAYLAAGQYQKSTEYLQKKIEVMDSTFTKEKMEAIAEIETEYQKEKDEAEIKLLASTVKRQRNTLVSAIIGLLLIGVIAYLFYRQSVVRQRNNHLLIEKNGKIESLHQELSHRIKNNLAFVSSLMRMQARRLESEEAKQAVKEGEARIEAMSLLHRKLYLQDTVNVDAGEYLKELCSYLQHSYLVDKEPPQIEIVTPQLSMNGEDAMRLGLIINELVTNSFKYAFAEKQDPRIEINLSPGFNGSSQLTYKDNGVGLPAELEIRERNSLGLKLIHTLARQLNGKVEHYNDKGAFFRIDFENRNIA